MSVAGVVAVSESVATWVPEESVTVSVPVRAPDAVGANTMESVQPVDGASVVPQELAVMEKSPAMTGVWSVAAVPPVFEIVMASGMLVAPTFVAAKGSVVGVRTMAAAGVPVPLRVAVA